MDRRSSTHSFETAQFSTWLTEDAATGSHLEVAQFFLLYSVITQFSIDASQKKWQAFAIRFPATMVLPELSQVRQRQVDCNSCRNAVFERMLMEINTWPPT